MSRKLLHYIKRKPLLFFVNVFFVLFIVVVSLYYAVIRRPSASVIGPITNQARISYCTEGDPVTACDPANNLFSGSATSNVVTTTITTPVTPTPTPTPTPTATPTHTPAPSPSVPPSPSPPIPTITPTPKPTTTPIPGSTATPTPTATPAAQNVTIPVQSVEPGVGFTTATLGISDSSGNLVARFDNVAVNNNAIQFNDQTALSSLSQPGYSLIVKVDGYLAVAIPGTSLTNNSYISTVILQPGDLNNNGQIDFPEITRIINYYVQKTKNSVFPNGLKLSDINRTIRLYVTKAKAPTLQ